MKETGGQMTELLLKVSGKLEGLERVFTGIVQEQKQLRDEQTEIRIHIAKIEQDEKWTGQERRDVKRRLGTGDHTFLRIETKAQGAFTMAEEALEVAQAIEKLVKNLPQRETGIRKRIRKLAIDALVPLITLVLWQLAYHLLLVGPKLAALMKAAREGGNQ